MPFKFDNYNNERYMLMLHRYIYGETMKGINISGRKKLVQDKTNSFTMSTACKVRDF
jgi:hypothetical protein